VTRGFTSGCWDLAHPGHLTALEFARSQCDHLTVSIASDDTIRALKREPVIREHDRWRLVAALRCVDHAFISRGPHGWDDCLPYVRSLRPDVWIVEAADLHREDKAAVAREVGARLVLFHRPEACYSTTSLIEKLKCR
jgi:D-beta-D-heptose 7-phosphate kinase/D-beta-D-heptose 1-phosphate adenosyltransferase